MVGVDKLVDSKEEVDWKVELKDIGVGFDFEVEENEYELEFERIFYFAFDYLMIVYTCLDVSVQFVV